MAGKEAKKSAHIALSTFFFVKQTQTSCNSVLTHFFSALISFESLFAIFFSVTKEKRSL